MFSDPYRWCLVLLALTLFGLVGIEAWIEREDRHEHE